MAQWVDAMSGVVKKTPNYQSGDQSSNQQNTGVQSTLDKLASGPLTGGSLLESIALAQGSNSVSHKLGTKLRGYFVVSQDKSATFYKESSDTTILKLNSSGPCTVNLYVF